MTSAKTKLNPDEHSYGASIPRGHLLKQVCFCVDFQLRDYQMGTSMYASLKSMKNTLACIPAGISIRRSFHPPLCAKPSNHVTLTILDRWTIYDRLRFDMTAYGGSSERRALFLHLLALHAGGIRLECDQHSHTLSLKANERFRSQVEVLTEVLKVE